MRFLLLTISTQDPATTWGAIVVGVLTIVYVVFIRPLRKKKDPLARPRDASAGKLNLSQQRSVERDMSNLLVELSEMTRQMTAQLDTRAAKLEVLLREADEKLAALRAETGRQPEAARGETNRHRDDAAVRHVVDRGFHAPADGPGDEPAADEYLAAKASARAAVLGETEARHAAVYDLADHGHPAHDIARQLGRPRGEIELILALRSGR